jgi:hypothetical protein
VAKKYIRGVFELELNVTDPDAFEEKRKPELLGIIDWATKNDVGVKFGTSEDNTYLCEFDTRARTVQMCKGYVAELKALLKTFFPKARVVLQYTGDILW